MPDRPAPDRPVPDRPVPNRPVPKRPLPASGLRAAVERASLPLLLRLSRLPRPVPFLVLLAALVIAVLVGGPTAVVLTGCVVMLVAWLMYLSWPRLGSSERLGRVAVLLLAVALLVTQAFPR